MDKYPYYIVPQVEEYRKLDPTSERAVELSRIIAANVGDYASLRLILGIDPPEFARFYPDMETTTPTTIDTIDSFLDKYGNNLPETLGGEISGYKLEELPEEQALPDIEEEGTKIKEEEPENIEEPRKFQESIQKELEPPKGDDEPKEIEEESPEKSFQLLIKNRKYEEALQIIERQNLINPQKSIYFAHQIRFIRKLMAVEKYRKETQG